MYSVEDLLISHGYKPSRDLPAPREDNPKGRQAAGTGTRAGQGLQNGHEDGSAALAHRRTPAGKGHVSDSESRRSTPRGHGETQSASASRTSHAGFSNHPNSASAWSSHPPTANDQAQRRRGRQAARSQKPRGREDLEARGMAQAYGLPVHMREGPWEVGGRSEHAKKKAVWEEELRMSAPAKWQNVSLESWSQPRKLGRQMSDGDGERLFQDLYPFIQGEHVLNSQNKGKSRSLPKVLSPEGLGCTEIPIPLHDRHSPKLPPYPPTHAPNLDSTRNSEKGGCPAPFPRPKFGRPLKPPSYGSHQQSRGGADSSDSQDSQQMDAYVPRHELCLSDPGLEPPVYVPPPSYRSPPQNIPNPYLEDTAPVNVCGGHSQQQSPTEKAGASGQPPSGPPGTGNEYGASPRSPQELPAHPRPVTAYDGFVQYIPFDDPRLRHFKLAQPQGFCEDIKLDDKSYNSSPVTAQEPAHGGMQADGATWNPQSLIPPSGDERGPVSANPSPRWLWGQLPGEGENSGLPSQRDLCVARGQRPDVRGSQHGHTRRQVSSPYSQGESTCETQTKLKKFETGSRTKKSSKKRMNETIFCLVSIPVKSESHLPDRDMDNNDLKPSADQKNGSDKSPALQEQSLLSMSSTDLELQALTGSMGGRTEFQKQDLGEPEDSQTNDLRFIHLTKHRELKHSGSWPGHRYRDQQTQTSFSEEPQSSQLLPGAKPGGSSHAPPSPIGSDPAASEAQMPTALPSGDHKQRPSARHLKGHRSLSPSGNSAFSRTSLSVDQAPVPKAGRSQPCVDVHRLGGHPEPKREVVKGEPTGPCNSKQLFGQFLLKPVSRRPWDLISQLESFNKELQEEEESSSSSRSSSGEETEAEPQQENVGFRGNSPEMRVEPQPRMWVPESPVCRSGRGESKSESWSDEWGPGHPRAWPTSPGRCCAEDGGGAPFWSADGNVSAQKRHPEVSNGMDGLAGSPVTVMSMSSKSSDAKPVPLSYPAEPRELQGGQKFTSAFSSVKPSQAAPRQVDSGGERAAGLPLSLSNKNRGLSAPDLRSVGLTPGQEQGASELEGSLGEASVVEIPPGESLQARAARILGIEVAVESLLPGTQRAGQNHPAEPDASACTPESPQEEPPSGPAPAAVPRVSTDSFYGRRKCGWTKSPLFVGDRDSAKRAPQAFEDSDVDGVVTSTAPVPEPEPSPSESKSFEQKDVEAKPPFRSTLFHFVEGPPSVAGSEKRLRSPSKVIESLQEKLASPPRRADADRLMRMKEVSSVSRMRFLSSRNADCLEEAEELKATTRGQAGLPGGLVSPGSGDRAWRGGHSLSVSKDSISKEEKEHPAAQKEKSLDQDFWCPDSYDPSRVERV
ncbi:junctional protein associated with coronary artery disease isoform X1 [Cebus imitator]|uniref:Junctional cadherin 5 associated n=2 Tax=Cebus imitator TaxID=2715852 RepID=A0A2K5PJ71_CEBIM|nr:junctional protein associated with coronary artery disease isoform X1 [Cebus imitator]XP_017390929.1 junctional protein associated with coronary artery disease isoform X1 [Cebus imitator]XP_037596873.1 junctional protein associated with coronary artery disease isoform X1 [Cebus imitator]XP_037596874.1 junctional protein associated with coronary artery disease isoform X1 [Cebus imitator]XP_037596875.1 junctional protein associated with coronary artery disease isoform X1 [Cebus imitator]XP_03